jgi:hypothetical protein
MSPFHNQCLRAVCPPSFWFLTFYLLSSQSQKSLASTTVWSLYSTALSDILFPTFPLAAQNVPISILCVVALVE